MKEETLNVLRSVYAEFTRAARLVRDDTDEVKKSGDHVEIIRHYDKLRIANEYIKETRKALSDLEELMSRETVPEAMRAAGVKTITIEDVGRITISGRYSCSVLDKPAAFKWLRDTGNEGLIQETVNSSTLSAFARRLIEEEGKEMPEDVFKISVMAFTSITKVK